jgi:nucleoside-triphosphatase
VTGRLLLLTGPPGAGKTTVIRRVAAGLPSRTLAGFYTEEIRVAGERRGFSAVTFDGRSLRMAHVGIRGRARVGKYGVSLAVVDELAATTLAPAPDALVYLVDEIGKMECLSERFVAALQRLLAGPTPVIATVAQRGAGLIAEVKTRPEAELIRVTRANRDDLPGLVLAWLGEGPASRAP